MTGNKRRREGRREKKNLMGSPHRDPNDQGRGTLPMAARLPRQGDQIES